MLIRRVTKQRLAAVAMFSMVLFWGCCCPRTNLQPMLQEIQGDAMVRAGHFSCCNEQEAGAVSIEQMLKQELTVDRAVAVALLNNYSLQATYSSLGIAQAQLMQAGLLLNPTLAASYRYSSQPLITNLIDIALLQSFLEIFLIPLKKQMASVELEATKARVTVRILDVIAQTKIAFYMFQALEQTWSLKHLVLISAESSYEAAQRLLAAGNITELELNKHHISYERTKQDLADLEVEVLEAREKLNVLMGLWGNQITWTASGCLPSSPERESDWDDSERLAIETSLDLDIARKELDVTTARFGINTTRMVFPRINFGPSSERDDSTWFVGPAVVTGIPVFDWGQEVAHTARAEILRQWNAYAGLAVGIRSSARAMRIRLLNAHRQVQYDQKVTVPLAERRTELVLQQHNARQLGVFDLLLTKIAELEKKIEAVGHLKDYWVARTELEFIVNGHMLPGKDPLPAMKTNPATPSTKMQEWFE